MAAAGVPDRFPLETAGVLSAAAEAGVTRLGDITGLDRIGFPVWQTIRPMSRALSVHQGKGLTHQQARIGALMEAIESDSAECFSRIDALCAYDALAPAERAPDIADFAHDRAQPAEPSEKRAWVAGARLDESRLFVPVDWVSLDLARPRPIGLDRSSDGLGAGFDANAAAATALREAIERDAVREWMAAGALARTRSGVRVESVPFGWFGRLRERIAEAGIRLQLYRALAVIATPVLVCELLDPAATGTPQAAVFGSACHSDPERALLGALGEALQSRAGCIAGARDDLLPGRYRGKTGDGFGFGLPLPPGAVWTWEQVEPGPGNAAATAAALAAAGYPDAAIVPLRADAVHVAKAFVAGLGSTRRRRRRPA